MYLRSVCYYAMILLIVRVETNFEWVRWIYFARVSYHHVYRINKNRENSWGFFHLFSGIGGAAARGRRRCVFIGAQPRNGIICMNLPQGKYYQGVCNINPLVVIKLSWNANEWPHDGKRAPARWLWRRIFTYITAKIEMRL